MSTAINVEPGAKLVRVTDEAIIVDLVDDRTISVPLAWSWRLSDATPEQRLHWELTGEGEGIRWPEIDEDISVEGMLNGIPARRPKQS